MIQSRYSLIRTSVCLVLLLSSTCSYSQDDETCWCKEIVPLPSGAIGVRNIDALVETRPDQWSNLEGCEEADCSEATCTWDYTTDIGGTQSKSGDCESEPFDGGVILWDTSDVEPGDCQCIGSKKISDEMIKYTNISEKAAEFPEIYKWVLQCDDGCTEKTCKYQVLDLETNTFGPAQEGICTKYWPKSDKKSAIVVGVEQAELVPALSFYPNPSSNMITVAGADNIKIQLFDLTGKLVLESNDKTISIASLSAGSYFIQLSSGDSVVKDILIIQ